MPTRAAMHLRPPPDTDPPPGRARRAALWCPGAYFVQTRLPTWRLRAGWLLGFALPVLALAGAAHGGAGGVPIALCMLLAVYAAYEFGYLVNDVVVTTRESHPTERLAPALRRWYAARLARAAVLRAAIGLAALAAAQALGGQVAGPVLAGWLALWPAFALYNRLRGPGTLALYLLLAGLRFVLPVLAAATPDGALPPWPAWLLLYALPNTFVAAWKPRYGWPALQRPFGHEARFRLVWHGVVAAGAIAWAWWDDDAGTRAFAAVAAWLLAVRLAALAAPPAALSARGDVA